MLAPGHIPGFSVLTAAREQERLVLRPPGREAWALIPCRAGLLWSQERPGKPSKPQYSFQTHEMELGLTTAKMKVSRKIKFMTIRFN